MMKILLNVLLVCIALNGLSQDLLKLSEGGTSKILGGASFTQNFYGRTEIQFNDVKNSIDFLTAIHDFETGQEIMIKGYKFIGFYKDSLVTLLNTNGEVVLYNTKLEKEIDFLFSSPCEGFYFNGKVKQIENYIYYICNDCLFLFDIKSKNTRLILSSRQNKEQTSLIDFTFSDKKILILVKKDENYELLSFKNGKYIYLYKFQVVDLTYDPVISFLSPNVVLLANTDSANNNNNVSFFDINTNSIKKEVSLGELIPINIFVMRNSIYLTLFSEKERLDYANKKSPDFTVLLSGMNIYKIELP